MEGRKSSEWQKPFELNKIKKIVQTNNLFCLIKKMQLYKIVKEQG